MQTVPTPPRRQPQTVLVHAVSPGRDNCEIIFPRVVSYRIELSDDRLAAAFDADSKLTLSPESVDPVVTRNQGLVVEGVDLDPRHLRSTRKSEIACY